MQSPYVNQLIHRISGERHSAPGLQAFAVEDPGNLGTGVMIQQLIDFFYSGVGGSGSTFIYRLCARLAS